MRTWIRLSLLVCLAATLAQLWGQTPEWRRYKNVPGNFSALMPGGPTETTDSSQSAAASHTIQSIAGSVGYTVVYVLTEAEQPVDDATFKIYRDAFLKGLPNCDLATEAAPSVAVTGYVGHWYRMNCLVSGQKFTFTGNLYWGRHYAYAVLAMFPTAPTAPPEASKFTDSFAIIDSSK